MHRAPGAHPECRRRPGLVHDVEQLAEGALVGNFEVLVVMEDAPVPLI